MIDFKSGDVAFVTRCEDGYYDGTIIVTGPQSFNEVGEHVEDENADGMTDFTSTIKLQNDD